MRERGFRAALHFYRAHFRPVFALSLSFYVAMIVLAALSVVELGFYAILVLAYLMVASIFWLQAPLARLMDDVRAGRPDPGIRRTFASLSPRLGSITAGTLLAAIAIYVAGLFLVLPGLLLLARWAIFIPVVVIEGRRMLRAFARSNELVRGHTGRVVAEILISIVVMIVIWSAVFAMLEEISNVWLAVGVVLVFLAVTTPPIPLMRTLSYYDLVDAAAKRGRA